MFTIYPKAVKVFKAALANSNAEVENHVETDIKPNSVEKQVAQSSQKTQKTAVTAALKDESVAAVRQGLGRTAPKKLKFKKFGNNECYTIIEKDSRDVFKTFVKNGWVDQWASHNGKDLRHPDFPGVLIGLGYPNDIDEDEAKEFGVSLNRPGNSLCCIMVTTNTAKASATVTASDLTKQATAVVKQGLGRLPEKAKFKKIVTNECYTIVEKSSGLVLKTFVKNGWVDQKASYNGKELRHPDFQGVLVSLGYPNDIDEDEAKEFGVSLDRPGNSLCCITVIINSTESATVTAAKSKAKTATKVTKKPLKATIGLFYSYYKRPLNYLFSILAKPRKTAEQKETVKSLMAGLRKAEVKFQKEHKFSDSIVDLLINQRSLKLGKLEASFDAATASAVAELNAGGEIGVFYNMHKRPLSYLFALLKSPKLEKSDKKIVDSLVKGLRKAETSFMKDNDIKQSILDKLLKQRKLKLEASAFMQASDLEEKLRYVQGRIKWPEQIEVSSHPKNSLVLPSVATDEEIDAEEDLGELALDKFCSLNKVKRVRVGEQSGYDVYAIDLGAKGSYYITADEDGAIAVFMSFKGDKRGVAKAASSASMQASAINSVALEVVKQGLGRFFPKSGVKFKKISDDEAYTMIKSDPESVVNKFTKLGWNYNSKNKELTNGQFPDVVVSIGFPNDTDDDERQFFGIDEMKGHECIIMVTMFG